jgi:hypothetical protein
MGWIFFIAMCWWQVVSSAEDWTSGISADKVVVSSFTVLVLWPQYQEVIVELPFPLGQS